jgi:hypothetical protein
MSQAHTSFCAFELLESRKLLSASLTPDTTTPPLISRLGTSHQTDTTTLPVSGDVNPYGAFFVPGDYVGGGPLNPGDLIVDNFNNSGNLQGTGSTIMQITTPDVQSTFYQGSAGLGLSGALGVLKRGFVIVGSVPTTDGTAATIGAGKLLVLTANGTLEETVSNPTLLDGPWGMAVNDQGATAQLFISNVLSGTISRVQLTVTGHVHFVTITQIGSGFAHHSDPSALEVGPAGLVFDAKTNTLYVAGTADNKIFAISDASTRSTDAGTGTVIYSDAAHLRGPIGLIETAYGDLVTANGDAVNADASDPSELVEFTTTGSFVSQFSISGSEGGAFGLAIIDTKHLEIFCAVNDITNQTDVWNLHL